MVCRVTSRLPVVTVTYSPGDHLRALVETLPAATSRQVGLVMAEDRERLEKEIPAEYRIPDTSWRVLKLILRTAKLSNPWAGIKLNST